MIICHAFTGSADVEDWWGPLMGRGKAFDPQRFFILCANVLEWPLCTPDGYIRHVIPIATSARHSAWCISWGESQRESIYSDPGYEDGFYITQPASGLSAARMSALLTYRSRDSFESRFGRRAQIKVPAARDSTLTPPGSPPPRMQTPADAAVAAHNDGHHKILAAKPPMFSAQSYLRRTTFHDDDGAALARVLATLPPRALVISVASDGLFTPGEQREIAAHIPGAELVVIESPDGHDGFLLEFAQINLHVLRFLRREPPELYTGEDEGTATASADAMGFEVKKTSIFGEAEADLANW
ncbi:Alpha/Beta hydrolase protein [Mycena sp. CBHHK59/15]|nr:Alpha/Beta hydrolase protein [Mycena sp. CBHHK59/15]